MDVRGLIVGGRLGEVQVREKRGEGLELGELLVVEDGGSNLILQVNDLSYGSQIPEGSRELLAGMSLDSEAGSPDALEPALRNYVIARVKAVARVTEGVDVGIPKRLPPSFSTVRRIREEDLRFLTKPGNPVYLGRVRSGSKVLGVGVYLNGVEALPHHILVPAITGRGKSNLVKVLLWSVLDHETMGVLVLDPHDEYYGLHETGLKDHPKARERLVYYSPAPPEGGRRLVIGLGSIRPLHLEGILELTEEQRDAVKLYFSLFGRRWIESIVREEEAEGIEKETVLALKRKFDDVLGVYLDGEEGFQCRSRVFSDRDGETTVEEIIQALGQGKTVVIGTIRLMDEAELLIGSIIANSVFNMYVCSKAEGTLEEKPVVAIVLEEAPRALSAQALEEKGPSIYSTIAREGRKFKIGLIAITQLTSTIPKDILTNMNTKIVLGNEMASERRAIIDSASQDLSEADRTIASLDRGEAIVTSLFTRFAVPLKVPLFEEYAKAMTGTGSP